MKRKSRIFLLSSWFLVLFFLVSYFLLAYYYRQGFAINTWINGVYCTGKSVEEVNSELLSRAEAPIVIITDSEGKKHQILLDDLEYQEDYLEALHTYMEEENPLLWIKNILFHRNYELIPQISYDVDALKEMFTELAPIKSELRKQPAYFIAGSADEYKLYDNLSDRMDVDKAFQAVVAAIDAGETDVDLRILDCYYDLPMTPEQEAVKELWEKIQTFQKCDIIYDMGDEKIALTPQVVSGFLQVEMGLPVLDENGELILNRDAVKTYIGELAEEYDTYGGERKFMSTKGELITVKGGNYGSTLDQEAEVKYLMEHLLLPEMHTGSLKEHIPVYKREGLIRGRNDIGTTYIEVDMTQQKLYCYVRNELKLETDIVTGNMRRNMDTPTGVNYVYNKQRDRILRGPGYASPVDY